MSQPEQSTHRAGSKIDQAAKLMHSMTHTKQGKVRNKQPRPCEVQKRFIDEIGISKQMASTYYYTIKKNG